MGQAVNLPCVATALDRSVAYADGATQREAVDEETTFGRDLLNRASNAPGEALKRSIRSLGLGTKCWGPGHILASGRLTNGNTATKPRSRSALDPTCMLVAMHRYRRAACTARKPLPAPAFDAGWQTLMLMQAASAGLCLQQRPKTCRQAQGTRRTATLSQSSRRPGARRRDFTLNATLKGLPRTRAQSGAPVSKLVIRNIPMRSFA